MKNTVFVTPSGLDEGNHSSSAYDMALLAAEVMKQPFLAEICGMKSAVIQMGNPKRDVSVYNHNRLLSLYPYAVGLKTGYTTKSGRCLVSAARKDGVLLIAVTLNGRDYWDDHVLMYDYGYSLVEGYTPELPALTSLPIAGGETDTVSLSVETASMMILHKGDGERVTVKVELPRFLIAPVSTGEQVGTITYYLDDKELCSLRINADYQVDSRPVAPFKERWLEYFWLTLSEMLH